MIGHSKKLFYATEAVLYIAYNAADTTVSSKEIAERQGLPPRYLEQIMQRLVRAGVLRGVRGPRGGYLLARERRRISVADIWEVIRGDDDLEAAIPSTALGIHVMVPVWDRLDDAILTELRTVTLQDLCERAGQLGVKKAAEEKLDFAI